MLTLADIPVFYAKLNPSYPSVSPMYHMKNLLNFIVVIVSACASPHPVQADLPIQVFHSICNPIIHTQRNLFRTSPFLYTISASPHAHPCSLLMPC